MFCSAQRPQAWPGACAATASVPVLSCLNARLPKGDRLGTRESRFARECQGRYRSAERRADAGKSKQMSAVGKGIERCCDQSSREVSILNVVLVGLEANTKSEELI